MLAGERAVSTASERHCAEMLNIKKYAMPKAIRSRVSHDRKWRYISVGCTRIWRVLVNTFVTHAGVTWHRVRRQTLCHVPWFQTVETASGGSAWRQSIAADAGVGRRGTEAFPYIGTTNAVDLTSGCSILSQSYEKKSSAGHAGCGRSGRSCPFPGCPTGAMTIPPVGGRPETDFLLHIPMHRYR